MSRWETLKADDDFSSFCQRYGLGMEQTAGRFRRPSEDDVGLDIGGWEVAVMSCMDLPHRIGGGGGTYLYLAIQG